MQTSKNVLVIGGGSTIGSAIIRTMIEAGHNVTSTYFATQPKQGGAIKCDLRDFDQVKLLFDVLPKKIDLLVTAAFPFLMSENLDFDGFLEADPFLKAHVKIMTEMAKRMKGGKIINLLGQCVERGLPGGAFYSAAFAYLHNLGHSINALEGRAGMVSVCDLLLGPVDTREWDGISPDLLERYRAKVSQFISPLEVAEYVEFLADREVMPSTIKLDAYYGY